MNDSRYPYTYACDFIRSFSPVGINGVVLSRSDASQIRKAFSEALNLPDEEVAIKLADHYKKNEEKINEASSQKLLDSILNR